MDKIKKGDIVGRISYGKDILFKVEKIIKKANGKNIAILKGIILRITNMRSLENKIEEKIKKGSKNKIIKLRKRKFLGRNLSEETGKILHLDGDKKYSEKSLKLLSLNIFFILLKSPI